MTQPFPDYDMASLPDDDADLAKWLSVRNAAPPQMRVIPSRRAIELMNASINEDVRYQAELPGVAAWQSPLRTWTIKSGDCKDYASLKYAVLRSNGIQEANLLLVCCELTVGLMKTNQQHAFLLARIEGEWAVLDSKFPGLISPDAYVNCRPLKAFSAGSGWLYSRTLVMSEAR